MHQLDYLYQTDFFGYFPFTDAFLLTYIILSIEFGEIYSQYYYSFLFFLGDLIVKSTQNKLTKVMAEVDSLKAVLEMKTEEIHALRLEKAKLEDKLEEFDRMKLEFGKVTAQLEDLKAQLNEKQVVERKLSEENRQLYDSVERELNAKRRITMEKEELEWRIRSSSRDGTMSMSMMEGV